MLTGNYEVQTPQGSGHSWLWDRQARASVAPDCVHVQAAPRTQRASGALRTQMHASPTAATPWSSSARWRALHRDLPPSHDTYSWDAVTLAGSVDSTSTPAAEAHRAEPSHTPSRWCGLAVTTGVHGIGSPQLPTCAYGNI